MVKAVRLSDVARPRESKAAEPRAFGVILRDLLIDRGYVTAMGNPNWAEFVLGLEDVHYESLRKAVTGERWPGAKIMEEAARVLEVSPSIFYEYQLYEAQRAFDPKEVGADVAFENLRKWVESQD